MRLTTLFSLASLFLLSCSSSKQSLPTSSEWQFVGPVEPHIREAVSDSRGNLFVSSGGIFDGAERLFRSSLESEEWSLLPSVDSLVAARRVGFHLGLLSDRLYLLMDDNSFYRSVDMGETWEFLSNVPSSDEGTFYSDFAIAEVGGHILLCVDGVGHGIYRSADGGVTWEWDAVGRRRSFGRSSLASLTCDGEICAVVLNGKELFLADSDTELSWSDLSLEFDHGFEEEFRFISSLMLAGEALVVEIRTTSDETRAIEIRPGEYDGKFEDLSGYNSNFFEYEAGAMWTLTRPESRSDVELKILRRSSGKETWDTVGSWPGWLSGSYNWEKRSHTFIPLREKLVWVGASGRYEVSNGERYDVRMHNRGLDGLPINAIYSVGDSLLVVGAHLYVADRQALEWQRRGAGSGTTNLSEGTLYSPSGGGDLMYATSEDNGLSWSAAESTDGTSVNNEVGNVMADGCLVFVPRDNGVLLRSLDCGETWGEVPLFPTPSTRGYHDFDMNGTAEALLIYDRIDPTSQIHLSYDKGETWQISNPLPEGAQISDVAISRDYAFVATREHGLYRTDDRGQTWERILYHPVFAEGDFELTVGKIYLKEGLLLIHMREEDEKLDAAGGYLLYSEDGGREWSTPEPVPHHITAFLLHDNRLYVAFKGHGVAVR